MQITTLLSDLASVVHGTTVNKVPNIYGHINRAAREILLDVDPKETQRIVQLTQVFNNTFDYPIPVDVKGDRIIDLALQAGRMPWEVFGQTYAESFDAGKLTSFKNTTYTQWNTGVKTIRIEAPFLTSPVELWDTGTITGVTATPGAQNVTLDQTNNVAGGGAIVFDLVAGPTSGTIQTSSLNPTDLSALVNIATGFLWVYIPTAASVTSINVAWGTDSSNYYTYTATTTQQNTAFTNGWNLIALPWVNAILVGTPTNTLYEYVTVTVNYDGTLQTGFKVCELTFTLGYYFNLQYYSKYLFRTPSGVFVESIVDSTQNNYSINLDTESYNLLFNKTAYYIAQALQGADASYDADFWQNEYNLALKRYQGLNPSEAKNKAEPYYNMPRKGYGRYIPGLFRR